MKLYKVKYNESVVVADDDAYANSGGFGPAVAEMAVWAPAEHFTYEEVKSLDDLPPGWSAEDEPFEGGTPCGETIEELLAPPKNELIEFLEEKGWDCDSELGEHIREFFDGKGSDRGQGATGW